MKQFVLIAFILCVAWAGCTQKEPKKITDLNDSAILETAKRVKCDLHIGGIHFTKSKNGAEQDITIWDDM